MEDFECQETLAETCKLDDLERTGLSRLTLKTGTIRRLSNNVNTSSEACQEQCEMILLGDKTPKEKTTKAENTMQLLLFLSPRVPSTRYVLCSS